MERIILHIDVNNAFLSWTAVDMLKNGYKEDIRNIPSIICGSKETRTGIVLAKSNPAKKMGVVTAETIYSAFRKCPNLKTFPPNHDLYAKYSDMLFSLLQSYSPDIEVASIDECYMDYGKVKSLYGDEVKFAYKLKDEIKEKLGFSVNIGIGNNKLCAKMASDFSKPDKVHTLYEHEIKEKMWILPIGELFGVGKQTSEKLVSMGIKTIGDLALYDSYKLSKYFKNSYRDLKDHANGIDDSEVVTFTEVKGISNEITLSYDIDEKKDLLPHLLFLANKTSKRLRDEGKYASVICVILKDSNFRRKSHQKKIKNGTNNSKEIYEVCVELLNQMWKGESVRLIGVRLDDLSVSCNYQVSLFENFDREKEEKIDEVLDNINKKYGFNVIKKGSSSDIK